MAPFRSETFNLMLQQALASADDEETHPPAAIIEDLSGVLYSASWFCLAFSAAVVMLAAAAMVSLYHKHRSESMAKAMQIENSKSLAGAMIELSKSSTMSSVKRTLASFVSVSQILHRDRDNAGERRAFDRILQAMLDSMNHASEERLASIAACRTAGILTEADTLFVIATNWKYLEDASKKILLAHNFYLQNNTRHLDAEPETGTGNDDA